MAKAKLIEFFAAGMEDVNGNPLSGYQVRTYAPDGSTPKVVWQDRDKTLPTSAGLATFALASTGRYSAFGDGLYTVKIWEDTADPDVDNPYHTEEGVEAIAVTVDIDDVVQLAGTYAAAQALSFTSGGKVFISGRTTTGDGCEGLFTYLEGDYTGHVAADTQKGIFLPLSTDPDGESGCLVREYDGDINLRWFSPVGDAGPAMRGADACAAFLGGGNVFYPGAYTVETVGSELFEALTHRFAVKVSNKVTHKGVFGATKITMAEGTNAHCFWFNDPTDSGVCGFEIDGNRVSQDVQNPSTGNDPSGILVVGEARRLRLEKLYIHDTPDYGIGIQTDNAYDCTLKDIIIERPGADGIDAKNRDDNSRGNVMENIIVRDMQPSAGQDNQQAAINPYGIWHLNNISIFELSDDNVGIRFNAGEASDSGGFGGHHGTLTNFFIEADASNPNVIGIMADARYTKISNGSIRRGGVGIQIRQRENSISDVFIESPENDGVKTVTGAFLTEPERNTLTNVTVRAAVDCGFEISTDYNRLVNCVTRACDKGFVLLTGADQNSIIGGESTTSTTAAVVDDGSGNTITNVFGVVTESQVQSSTFDIATTGTKIVVVPHGLAFAPLSSQCQVTVVGGQNDVEYGFARIAAVDATNVTVNIGVSTASAVGGATASVSVRCRVKG